MDTSTAVPWVLHSGAMTLLVLSGPLPIRLSQAMQTQSIPGGKEPCSPLVCGMSRWMMLCPRVLGGCPESFSVPTLREGDGHHVLVRTW